MTDLLGPADSGAPRTLSTTADVSHPTSGDTWYQDCVAYTPGTGTPVMARALNRQLQQMRRVIRLAGVPLSNTDDDMLGQAIQSGAINWTFLFGGSANALTATLSPGPLTLVPGLMVRGVATLFNTGPATLNVNGLGPAAILGPSGLPLWAGFIQPGVMLELIYDGTQFRSSYVPPLTTNDFYVSTTGSDSTGDGLSPGTAWATLAHAYDVLKNFSTPGGINIHLATGNYIISGANTAFSAQRTQIGTWNILGGSSLASDTLISVNDGGGRGFVTFGDTINISNVRTNANFECYAAQSGGVMNLQDCDALSLAAGVWPMIGAYDAGSVRIYGVHKIGGTATQWLSAIDGNFQVAYDDGFTAKPTTIAIGPGTVFASATVSAINNGKVLFYPTQVTWSGNTPTGARYGVNTGGGINTQGSGTNYIPGSSAGSVTSPGWYA